MRAAVIHQHTNNFGDDAAGSALLDGLVDLVGAESIDLHYIWHRHGAGLTTAPSQVRHHRSELLSGQGDRRPALAIAAAVAFLHPALTRGDLRALLRSCRRADVTFVAPAGSNIGIYKDWMYLLSLAVLVRGGVTPVFCQNTIAASGSRPFDAIAKYVLAGSRVYVRERRSLAHLESIGVRARLGVDTALMLAPRPEPTGARNHLTVVPTRLSTWHRDHRGLDDHTFLHATLPNALAEVALCHDLEVHVLAHLYGPEAEAELLESIRAGLAERGCRARVVTPTTFEAYADDLATAAAVVSMRYHGLVLSGLSAVPCVALAYENKMREAAAYLGQDDLLAAVETTDSTEIAALLERALSGADDNRDARRAIAAELHELAASPVRDLVGSSGMQLRGS